MYFKIFTISSNTENLIKKAGFTVNSLQEVKVFHGDKETSINYRSKDYFHDGNIWEAIEVSSMYERLLLLIRQPLLPFDKLWNLFLGTDKEDSFGSLTIISNIYLDNVITELNINKEKYKKGKKHQKMIELKKYCLDLNSQKGNQVAKAISDLLN